MKRSLSAALCLACLVLGSSAIAQERDAAAPAPKPSKPSARTYLRSDPHAGEVQFSARKKSEGDAKRFTILCIAPCDRTLEPGVYELKLNQAPVERPVRIAGQSTLYGTIESNEGRRISGLVALYLGGILGGSLIGVAALGAPDWTYAAGGGAIVAAGVVFLLTYKADEATLRVSAGAPADSVPMNTPELDSKRSSRASTQSSGLGLRVLF